MGTRHWAEDAEDYCEELESEVAQLTKQLAKANERVKELGAHNELLMDVSWQMKEGKPDAFYKIKDARNTQPSDALNKFAIEQQYIGGKKLLDSIAGQYSPSEISSKVCLVLAQNLEQLRKEQE